jgi:DNA-binding transcriptional ArsR family regulator
VSARPVADLLVTFAEPTRLRILNCLSTALLFVADLASILAIPEDRIVEHLDALEDLGIVRTHEVMPYMLYALAPLPASSERLLRAVLDAMRNDPGARADRASALARSRSRLETRVGRAVLNAS